MLRDARKGRGHGSYNAEQAVLEATARAGKRSLRLTAALKLMHRA
nr:hypothetical protein [Bradyrhizobium sp. CCBAU 53415]